MPERRNRLNGSLNNGKAQNGSELPFWENEEWEDKTLDDLASIANESHDRVIGTVRTTAECARRAGEALNEAKKKVKRAKGSWTDWEKENFRGSPETSRVYRRIADNWDKIVKEGLENKSLAFLRACLAKVMAPGHKRMASARLPEPDMQEEGGEAHEEEPLPDAQEPGRTFHLPMSKEVADEFDDMVEDLQDRYEQPDPQATVLEAVRRCYEGEYDAE